MPKTKISFDVVREIALGMADVEDSTMYGSPALKARGKLLAGLPVNKSAEPESLGVCIDFDQRDALLAEAPETYYVTDHYVNYPVVLVRLSQIRMDELRDLLNSAWRFVTSKKRRTGRTKLKKRRESRG